MQMDRFPSLNFAQDELVGGAIGQFQGSRGAHCDALSVKPEFQFVLPQIDFVEVDQLVGSAPGKVVLAVHLPTGSPHSFSKVY
jgi:hypothetical protein